MSTPNTVTLRGLSARGYHGVLPSERAEGQIFSADVTLFLEPGVLDRAAASDDIAQTVDYSQVANAVVEVIHGEPVNLIETLADRVAQSVLAFSAVAGVEVTIHKPQAPLEVAFDDVAVTLVRGRTLMALAVAGPDQMGNLAFTA